MLCALLARNIPFQKVPISAESVADRVGSSGSSFYCWELSVCSGSNLNPTIQANVK